MTMINGLTWIECEVPNRDWAMAWDDVNFLSKCVKRPVLNSENDRIIAGEHVRSTYGMTDFRIIIGEDQYETKVDEKAVCCQYKLIKDGVVILPISASVWTNIQI